MLPAASPQALADEADDSPEVACRLIESTIHTLATAEHDEAFALDLASGGGATAAVQARLSDLVERTQDLRVVLGRVRSGKLARDLRMDGCLRMGAHALAMAEKLSSDIESVLYGGDDSFAENWQPTLRPDASAPATAPVAAP